MEKWLIKSHEASLLQYGQYPGARSLDKLKQNGIIILDKPPGPTSHQVDGWIKDILKIKKASHAGTIDPRYTGVLVIMLENATKLMPILLTKNKEYVGIVHLHKEVSENKIREIFFEFIGKQKQLPPKKSAVKRRVREREVYDLEILEINGRDVLFRMMCEAGFYVRRFADDVGKKLRIGAHLKDLRRTKSGSFTEQESYTLHELVRAMDNEDTLREIILPMEIATRDIGKVVVSDRAIANIVNGSPLYVPGVIRLTEFEKGEWVAMFTLKGELIAIGKAAKNSKEIHQTKKGTAVKTDRVLMKKEVYPKV